MLKKILSIALALVLLTAGGTAFAAETEQPEAAAASRNVRLSDVILYENESYALLWDETAAPVTIELHQNPTLDNTRIVRRDDVTENLFSFHLPAGYYSASVTFSDTGLTELVYFDVFAKASEPAAAEEPAVAQAAAATEAPAAADVDAALPQTPGFVSFGDRFAPGEEIKLGYTVTVGAVSHSLNVCAFPYTSSVYTAEIAPDSGNVITVPALERGRYSATLTTTLAGGQTESQTLYFDVCDPYAEEFGLIWPVDKNKSILAAMDFYSSGEEHNWGGSVDISADYDGDIEIYAAASGTVLVSGYRSGGSGYTVRILHDNGKITAYVHLTENLLVSEGQRVAQGQPIGYMGSSGNALNKHLHFEVQSDEMLNKEPVIETYLHHARLALSGVKVDGRAMNVTKAYAELIPSLSAQHEGYLVIN